MENKIVFTDFDGTYIKGDSYIRSLLFFSGYLNFIKNSPELAFIAIEYLLKFIPRDEAKRRSYERMFKGVGTETIDRKLSEFYCQMHVFPKVKKKIGELREAGCKIIVVTASPDIYMKYMAEKFGFDGLICTETERDGGILTGKLKGKNCNYSEKVSRIKNSEFFNPDAQIIVFGNSKGDEEMFKISTEFYFVDKSGNIKKGKTPW